MREEKSSTSHEYDDLYNMVGRDQPPMLVYEPIHIYLHIIYIWYKISLQKFPMQYLYRTVAAQN